MQVEQVLQEKLKYEYNVTVPANTVVEAVDAKLKIVAKDLKMEGFRPGKVPADIVKKNYGQRVLGEVLEKLVDSTSHKAITDAGLRPAMRPKIEITDFKEGAELKYKMEFEIIPEVPSIDFTAITIERPKVEIAEKDVDEALKQISQHSKNFAKVERAAKDGDAVQIDFEGFVGDEAFEGGAGKDFQLELGSNSFIPGFEEQLIGSKAGDNVDVNVKFPDEYHSEALAGKEALFKVTIHEVKEAAAAEINDELAKTMGFDNVDALKKAVKEQIQSEISTVCRSHAKKTLFDVLDSQYKFDVPEGMKQMEFDAVWAQVEDAKKQNPDDEEFKKPEDELKAEYRDMADRRVKLGLVLSELGKQNEVQISQEEVQNAVFAEARKFPGQEQKVFEHYQEHPEHLEALKGPILEEKVVDIILEKITITDKNMSVDELKEYQN